MPNNIFDYDWLMKIVVIEIRGFHSFRKGRPRQGNPYYITNPIPKPIQPGPKRQMAKRLAWFRGWDMAEEASKNKTVPFRFKRKRKR